MRTIAVAVAGLALAVPMALGAQKKAQDAEPVVWGVI